jgi:hypothetical protein
LGNKATEIIWNNIMAKPKKPREIPSETEKPEIKPFEEQPDTWPKKEPEIVPGKEPDKVMRPNEIPPLPEEK